MNFENKDIILNKTKKILSFLNFETMFCSLICVITFFNDLYELLSPPSSKSHKVLLKK